MDSTERNRAENAKEELNDEWDETLKLAVCQEETRRCDSV